MKKKSSFNKSKFLKEKHSTLPPEPPEEKTEKTMLDFLLEKIDFIIKDHKGLKKNFIFILLMLLINMIFMGLCIRYSKIPNYEHVIDGNFFNSYRSITEFSFNYIWQSIKETPIIILSINFILVLTTIFINKTKKKFYSKFLISVFLGFILSLISEPVISKFLNLDDVNKENVFNAMVFSFCFFTCLVMLVSYAGILIFLKKPYEDIKENFKNVCGTFFILLLCSSFLSILYSPSLILCWFLIINIATIIFIIKNYVVQIPMLIIFLNIKLYLPIYISNKVYSFQMIKDLNEESMLYNIVVFSMDSSYLKTLLSLSLIATIILITRFKKNSLKNIYRIRENRIEECNLITSLTVKIGFVFCLIFFYIIAYRYSLISEKTYINLNLIISIVIFSFLTLFLSVKKIWDKKNLFLNIIKLIIYVIGTYLVFYGVVSACENIYEFFIYLIMR